MADRRHHRAALEGEAVVVASPIYCHIRGLQEEGLKGQRLDRENELNATSFLRNSLLRRGDMKPRLTERKVVVLFIVAQAILALSESSVSAQHDTFPLIRDLNPSRVQVVVNSSSEFQKTFSDLAVGALKRAGIDIAAQDNKYSNKAKSVELILTVKPEPLSDICPGQVMYEPSIALVEEIIVPRANEVIKGSTWASFQPPHIRQTLSRKELEQKISELIEGFIIKWLIVRHLLSTVPAVMVSKAVQL